MRKLLWTCCFALYGLASISQAAVPPPPPPSSIAGSIGDSTNILAAAKKAGVLRVGSEPDFPPLYWLGEDGKEKGFDYEMAQLIAKELGIPKIEIKDADYDKLPDMARQGKIDIFIAGYGADPELNGIEWSNSYLDYGLCLIVPKGSPVKNIKQLKGKTIGVYDDPVTVRWVKDTIPNIKDVKTYMGPGWLYHVDNRDVDAAIYDYPLTVTEIKSFNRLHIAAFNLNETSYAVGFKAGNKDLQAAINNAIAKIKASDQYTALIKEYMPAHATTEVPENSKLYTVQEGELLTTIAAKHLGDSAAWKTIWELNKHRLPNPNALEKGDQLIMPTSTKVTP